VIGEQLMQNQVISDLERMVVAAELGAWEEVGEMESGLNEALSRDPGGHFSDEDQEKVLGYYDRLILLVKKERSQVSSDMGSLQRGNKQSRAYLAAC